MNTTKDTRNSTARNRRARRNRDENAWRIHLRSDGYSPGSVRTKVNAVATVAAANKIHPADLTANHVRAFLLTHPLKPNSRRTYLRSLRQYAAWARIPDPTADIRMPGLPPGLPNPIAERQLARLLEVATGRPRTYILLGAFCGLRAHETAKVHADDIIEHADGSLSLRVHGKGGKDATLPVPDVAADDLRQYLYLPGYLFVSPVDPPHHIRAEAVSRAISKLARDNGIRMRYHQLRHRFGTQIHRLKGDLLITQQAMRHSSPTSTAGYALVANTARTAVIRALPVPFINPDTERPAP